MKYENFKEVKAKVEHIDKLTEKLEQYNDPGIYIQLMLPERMVIGTIGAIDSEHTYKDQARTLVNYIIRDTEAKIQKLHDELSEL